MRPTVRPSDKRVDHAINITAYRSNGGTLAKAAALAMANHASICTTQLYDRRRDATITLGEVERIRL